MGLAWPWRRSSISLSLFPCVCACVCVRVPAEYLQDNRCPNRRPLSVPGETGGTEDPESWRKGLCGAGLGSARSLTRCPPGCGALL